MNEIFRYMGIPPECADEKTKRITLEILSELYGASAPKHILREIRDISFFNSENLNKHTDNCKKFLIFAATLGTGADTVIRKYLKTDIMKASVAQAAATYLIEKYCDEVTASLCENGLFPKPRFSPGYGDFSLEHQETILKLLDADKRIGITLTESSMMIPTKSITAVIGLSEEPECHENKCSRCFNKNCQFRKED